MLYAAPNNPFVGTVSFTILAFVVVRSDMTSRSSQLFGFSLFLGRGDRSPAPEPERGEEHCQVDFSTDTYNERQQMRRLTAFCVEVMIPAIAFRLRCLAAMMDTKNNAGLRHLSCLPRQRSGYCHDYDFLHPAPQWITRRLWTIISNRQLRFRNDGC